MVIQFGIRCFDIDMAGNFPPQRGCYVGFFANLADENVFLKEYGSQRQELVDMDAFMFAGDVDRIVEMTELRECDAKD
jgi:hypothetical protein